MELSTHFQKIPLTKKYGKEPIPESKYLLTNDFIGIEIEVENIGDVEHPLEHWAVHTDGSLRNNGKEFVFAWPLRGSQVEQALFYLEGLLKKHYNPRKSARTSTHIHINVDDMSEEQLIKFCAVYLPFEKPIFDAYAPDRKSNHFCVAMHQCDGIIDALRGFHHAKQWKPFLAELREEVGRYGAFNLMALAKFSSIEFRHFQASWDAKEILEWCNVLLHLKRFAMIDDTPLDALVQNISRNGYVNFAYQIFEKRIADKLIRSSNYNDSIIEGLRLVQSLFQPRELSLPNPIKEHISRKLKEAAVKKKEIRKKVIQELRDVRRGLPEAGNQKEKPPEEGHQDKEARGPMVAGLNPAQQVYAMDADMLEQRIVDMAQADAMNLPRAIPGGVQDYDWRDYNEAGVIMPVAAPEPNRAVEDVIAAAQRRMAALMERQERQMQIRDMVRIREPVVPVPIPEPVHEGILPNQEYRVRAGAIMPRFLVADNQRLEVEELPDGGRVVRIFNNPE